MIINIQKEGLKKTKVYDTYWKFACERQNIFMRKLMGEKDNLTEDIILREYKFTNTQTPTFLMPLYMHPNTIFLLVRKKYSRLYHTDQHQSFRN